MVTFIHSVRKQLWSTYWVRGPRWAGQSRLPRPPRGLTGRRLGWDTHRETNIVTNTTLGSYESSKKRARFTVWLEKPADAFGDLSDGLDEASKSDGQTPMGTEFRAGGIASAKVLRLMASFKAPTCANGHFSLSSGDRYYETGCPECNWSPLDVRDEPRREGRSQTKPSRFLQITSWQTRTPLRGPQSL